MAESILHFGAVRLRVNGSGNLQGELKGLDDALTKTVQSFTMAQFSGREPTKLTNFVNQRARLTLYTSEIDEQFEINRIIIYVKELYSQYPNG